MTVALSTTAPVKRALVRALRANAAITTGAPGGIHQGISPAKTRYPFITYRIIPTTRDYQWDGMQIYALVDIFAFSTLTPVEAENLDGLIANTLQDAYLTVDGQDLLFLRRVADITMDPETDARGRRVYQIGGSYRVITSQNFSSRGG